MFILPDLPYSYSALEPYIDEETMKIHHDKHHAAYVENLNAALEEFPELLAKDVQDLVANLEAIPEAVRTKVKNQGGGHANHSLFWTLMSPGKNILREGELKKSLLDTFGSLQTFKEKFTACAMGRFGSGWAWLVKNGRELEIIDSPNQETPLSEGITPIITLDIWEHAYYLRYQNRRADYIKAWWNVLDWSQAEKLFNS